MSDSLKPKQRLALIRLLNSLPQQTFGELVYALDVSHSLIPSSLAAQGDRSPALLQWVEGPTGCGLIVLIELLGEIAPKALQEVLGSKSESEILPPKRCLAPGAPFLAPPLPRHYVPRPEHLEVVKTELLDEAQPGTLVISAIYGMGGIGKSVLAAALVQESEVQQRFADGILWVTLGQQPDLLSMVNQWIRELGDYDYNPTTLDAASLHLRTLLADKQALLVVDDVWHPEHVKPFCIGGAGCRVLVTTRQTHIVGATRYDLDLLTPQQSLDLLTRYLPRELSASEQAEAEAFAKEVGYLPLALELAAAQVEEGVTWPELLEAFRAEMAILDLDEDADAITDEATRKQRSLVASFKLTLKLLSPQQLGQFAWLGIVPEDVSLTQPMAATLWDINAFQAGKLLRSFKNRALLLPQAQRLGEKPTYRIHDLVHDLAQSLLTHEQYLGDLPGSGLTVEQAHSEFLERYRRQLTDDLWHMVPDDGYIHQHLAWHFEQAQQPELLHQLLRESTPEGRNGWYEACERLGQTANFVTDVARAWAAAERLYTKNAIKSIALQCRYALITATLNSLAQNVPPELVVAFVQKGFWTPSQGLAYVRQTLEPFKRVDGLAAIVPLLPEALLSEALLAAYSIRDIRYQAQALCAFAGYLPSVASEVLSIVHSLQDESEQARILCTLAPYLPEEYTNEALELICSIRDEYLRADFLSALPTRLPQKYLGKVLEIARTTLSESYQVRILKNFASSLSEELMSQALTMARSIQSKADQAAAIVALAVFHPNAVGEALDLACSIEDEFSRAEALSTLAVHLPESLMSEALALAYSTKTKNSWTSFLKDLSPHLPESLMRKALALASPIQDDSDRDDILKELAPHLPKSSQDESKHNALTGSARNLPESLMSMMLAHQADSTQSKNSWINVLKDLASHLPESLMREALVLADSIQNESDKADILQDLASRLPRALMGEALAITNSIQDEFHRAKVLCAMAPSMPEIVSEVLFVARSIQNDVIRAEILSALAPSLPKSLMSEALTAACLIHSESVWADVLIYLAPSMSEVVNEALAVARTIQEESARANALIGLTPFLPRVVREALAVTHLIQEDSARGKTLTRLAPHLPQELMSEALAIAGSIHYSTFSDAEPLVTLAEFLPQELMGEALSIARSMQDEFARATALTGLVKYLPQDLMSEVLSAARSINYKSTRAKVLIGLAPYLPGVVSEALAVARSIEHVPFRADALIGLAPYLPEVVSEVLEVARSIQDKNSQDKVLIDLAPYLSLELMREALAIVHAIHSEPTRTRAMTGLAKYFPIELMGDALEVVCSIDGENLQADALAELIKYLPQELMNEALRITCSIQDESVQAEALINLAQYLPRELMNEVLRVVNTIKDKSVQAKALSRLTSYLPEIAYEALKVARSIQDKSLRTSALITLAPHMPSELTSEALEVARAIQPWPSRVQSLIDLAPYHPEVVSEILSTAYLVNVEAGRVSMLHGMLSRLKIEEIDVFTWERSLHVFASQARNSFISFIPQLSPAILSLSGGDKTALRLVVQAMREVCQQWP